MRAAVLDAFGDDVAVRDVADPQPGPGEVLVAVEACGVGLTLERARTGALGGTAPRIVGQSDFDPMMMPTSGFIARF